MEKGQFCFLSDQYYVDFPDKYLMRSTEIIGNASHRRPCFFVFQDNVNENILWLVPISSKYKKYKDLYDKKVEKYGRCNTIRFGVVLDTQAAFLIQNMCPITQKYILEVYVDKNNVPVQIDNRIVQDVVSNAREVLAMVERGSVLIFPDVKKIRAALLQQLNQS
jgi:hypothetical protein